MKEELELIIGDFMAKLEAFESKENLFVELFRHSKPSGLRIDIKKSFNVIN